MFNYIQFNCLECGKVMEYAVPSGITDAVKIEDIPPMVAQVLSGTLMNCSGCGLYQKMQFNTANNKLEVSL